MSAQEQDLSVDQGQDQVENEVDVAAMNDEQLESALDQTEEAQGQAADKDAKDASGAPEKEDAPVSVEDLNKRFMTLEKELEQTRRERDHWQNVTAQHTDELGKLRAIKAKILERQQQLRGLDQGDLMLRDPQAFANLLEERATLGPQLQAVERQEQEAALNVVREENSRMLQHVAPDFKDHMDDMATLIGELGYPPDAVKVFRTDPMRINRSLLVGAYALSKAVRENMSLKSEIEQLKAQPGKLLQKIDETARQRPITGATGGGKASTVAKADITDADIANMSDAELNALFEELKIKT